MKKYKLYEVSDYVTSKVSTSQLSLQDYVTTDCLLQNKCGRECAENLPPKSAKVTAYKPGDILISNIRPYLKKIWYANSEGGNSADVLTIRAKENFEKLYIYYMLFQDSFFDYVSKGVKGSKMPRGDKNHIMNFEILVPENLQVQKKIASTLSDFDKRIENLRAQNRVLEQTAKTIYDYTFLQCAGHQTTYNKTLNRNIPVDWEVKKIGEFFKLYDSKRVPLSKQQREKMKGQYPYYGATGVMDFVNDYLFDGDYILLAEDGSTSDGNGHPVVQLISGKNWVNNHAHIMLPNDPTDIYFGYYTLKCIPVKKIESGSIQKKISQENLLPFQIAVPDTTTMKSFNNQVTPLFKKQLVNTKQIEALTTQRNTLLPLLMTGQIEV